MKEYTGKEVIVMACSTCNANCSHCYVSYKGNRTPEDLLSIVRNLKKRYSLNINGAEVLTNFDYLKSYKDIYNNIRDIVFNLSNSKYSINSSLL